jgi:hypothetical protein
MKFSRLLARLLAVAAGVAVAAASHTPQARPAGAPQARSLVAALGSLTGGALSPAEIDDWTRRVGADVDQLDELIDELLDRPELGRELLPTLLFGTYLHVRNYYVQPTGFIMQQTSEPDQSGRFVYYIRKPCRSSEAKAVRPWWDPNSEVLVCPDAYRPERWRIDPEARGYHSRSFLSCDSQVGSPENEVSSQCGCGPALIRCVRDDSHYLELHRSLKREVERTVEYIVSRDLPIEELFTGNATFRDRNVELYYRRQKIGSLETGDVAPALEGLDGWPKDGKWARREEVAPGQHAGLLTAPQLLHWNPDRRQRQRAIFEMMWCEGRNSFGATTRQVLELNRGSANLAFVHDSWRRLAQTPICTDCHARLDYGFQFFHGYPDSRASLHYVPSLAHRGEGPFYGKDISDRRGQAPLTPRGFAEMAVEQPEFARCMTRHLVGHVLGPDAPAADHAAVRADLEKRHSVKSALRVALRRFVDRWDAAPPPPTPQSAPPRRVAGSEARAIGVSPALRAQLDRFCTDCHNQVRFVDSSVSVGRPFDLTGAALPRELMVRMTDHVAYGKMPKQPVEMTQPERDALVASLIDHLWADPAARAEATEYYVRQDRGLPVEPIDSAFRMIQRSTGAASGDDSTGQTGAADEAAVQTPSWGLLERGLWIDQASYTPGFATAIGLEALRACSTGDIRHRRGAGATERCLQEATNPETLVRGRIR